jgi:hypothetical protein
VLDESDRLPEFVHRYFWDIDPTQLKVSRRRFHVIERLLEHGDLPAVRWMEERFSSQEIAQVVRRSRALSQLSANFWVKMLDIPLEEVRCLSKPFRQRYRTIWPR